MRVTLRFNKCRIFDAATHMVDIAHKIYFITAIMHLFVKQYSSIIQGCVILNFKKPLLRLLLKFVLSAQDSVLLGQFPSTKGMYSLEGTPQAFFVKRLVTTIYFNQGRTLYKWIGHQKSWLESIWRPIAETSYFALEMTSFRDRRPPRTPKSNFFAAPFSWRTDAPDFNKIEQVEK
jgi:hypothetical protein